MKTRAHLHAHDMYMHMYMHMYMCMQHIYRICVMLRKYSVRKRHPAQGPEPRPTPLTTIETRLFRTFTSVNRREPVRIWCEHVHAHVHGVAMLNCCAKTRPLRPDPFPLHQSQHVHGVVMLNCCAKTRP